MKTALQSLFLTFLLFSLNSAQAQGTVNFDTKAAGPGKVMDFDGTPLSGTNFWAQLYSADGILASENDLLPAGTPVNFRGGIVGGVVQVSGLNARGQLVDPTVVVSTDGSQPASVQLRAWSGPFLTYEAAKSGGGRFGSSRILRMITGNPVADPPITPANLADAQGPVNSFRLGFGIPALSINDIVVAEGTNGTVQANFTVSLTVSSEEPITASIGTSDGSAIAGEDYVAKNGTVTFLPGQTNQTFSVTITADQPLEMEEDFFCNPEQPDQRSHPTPKRNCPDHPGPYLIHSGSNGNHVQYHCR